jgi:tetratricopeptide (TPR) repeat protein
MRSRILSLLWLLLMTAAGTNARVLAEDPPTPAFTKVPELSSGFRQLYIQKFPEARTQFEDWETQHPDEPFGQVAIAASYLFEEFYRQGVLTSDFFLNEKRFLHGIEGKPDPQRMKGFDDAIRNARKLATQRLAKTPNDPEALYALTLCAGMESDADMILKKHNLEALKRLKEANAHAKTLLAERPDAYDAYVALGSANYIIGSLSVGFRTMLWFGGVHGDKKLGMEQVSKTAEDGLYLKPFAKIMLALAARREKQNALAQKLLLELTKEFPESTVYPVEYAKAMGRPIPASVHP